MTTQWIEERASLALPQMWRLPERLSVVDFFATHHRLSSRYSEATGAPDISLTPHLVEVLESFTDPQVQTITLLFASQCQKTTALEAMLEYAVAHDPRPGMWCLPGEKSRDAFALERIKPTLEGSPKMRDLISKRGKAITRHMIDFITMPLFFALADSEADLASRPCGLVFADEIDKFPIKTSREGSPLDQLRARMRTFRRSKFVQSSTPTIESGAINRQYASSDRRVWTVPCPNCGEFREWQWGDVHWHAQEKGFEQWRSKNLHEDGKRPTRGEFAAAIKAGTVDVWWECPQCHHRVHHQADKDEMNRRGRWSARGPFAGHVGFHFNSLGSMWTSFRALAVKWQEAIEAREMGDDSRLQHMFIHEFAETWNPKRVRIAEREICERASDGLRPGILPDWCEVVTVGADVQHDAVFYVVQAWGRGDGNTNVHVVEHGRIEGDVSGLREVLAKIRTDRSGKQSRQMRLAFVDSGEGMMTASVYAFCASFLPSHRVRPIKGERLLGGGDYTQDSKSETAPHRGLLVRVSTVAVKDFWARLMMPESGTVSQVSFHSAVIEDEDFQRQMVSEERKRERNAGGQWVTAWLPRAGYAQNHYWDANIYATAAAIKLGIVSRKAPATRRQIFSKRAIDDLRARK